MGGVCGKATERSMNGENILLWRSIHAVGQCGSEHREVSGVRPSARRLTDVCLGWLGCLSTLP